MTLVVGVTAVIGLIAIKGGGDPSGVTIIASPATENSLADASAAGAPTDTAAVIAAVAGSDVAAVTDGSLVDLAGDDPAIESCTLSVQSVRQGSTGESVSCLQQALFDAGYYSGGQTGEFDQATYEASRKMQEDRNLFVDGIVGRESALSLGIWPDEASLVVRTPVPPAGAVDLLGYPLSSVASSGPDAPALPANSGRGKRLVYDRAGQRVWAVSKDEVVIRSWLIAGSKYSNELPGTHQVYSRSDVSTAWNGKAWLPKMVRWLKTDIGAIGFHAIPLHVEDDSPYQTEAELGQRLSGGCQRQANRDADFTWDFAQIGTTVVVI